MIEAGYPFVSFHKKKTLFRVFLLFLYFRFRDLFTKLQYQIGQSHRKIM